MDPEDAMILEMMEIDLDVAECGEILAAHGVEPSSGLLVALWEWKEGLSS